MRMRPAHNKIRDAENHRCPEIQKNYSRLAAQIVQTTRSCSMTWGESPGSCRDRETWRLRITNGCGIYEKHGLLEQLNKRFP